LLYICVHLNFKISILIVVIYLKIKYSKTKQINKKTK